METYRIVAGLDVHKDTIFLCIMGHDGSIIFQKNTVSPSRMFSTATSLWLNTDSQSFRIQLSTEL